MITLNKHTYKSKNTYITLFYSNSFLKVKTLIKSIHTNPKHPYVYVFFSKRETYGKYNSFKYFIGYNDNDVIRPLYLELWQMTGYINKFDKNEITVSLMVKDKQLLKNYNKIWKNNWKINENRLSYQNYLWWWW